MGVAAGVGLIRTLAYVLELAEWKKVEKIKCLQLQANCPHLVCHLYYLSKIVEACRGGELVTVLAHMV